jgi:hypothetical protein
MGGACAAAPPPKPPHGSFAEEEGRSARTKRLCRAIVTGILVEIRLNSKSPKYIVLGVCNCRMSCFAGLALRVAHRLLRSHRDSYSDLLLLVRLLVRVRMRANQSCLEVRETFFFVGKGRS